MNMTLLNAPQRKEILMMRDNTGFYAEIFNNVNQILILRFVEHFSVLEFIAQ